MNINRFNMSLDKNSEGKSKNGIIKPQQNKTANLKGQLIVLPINKIEDDPNQARSFIKNEEFLSLKQSIKREGLLHPIIVYKDNDKKKYILKSGHRRIKAIKELGYTEVQCAVYLDAVSATFAAVSSNEFAESIHPIDKGVQVQSLIEELKGANQSNLIEAIAKFYGAKESTIYEWLRYSYIDKSIRAKIIELNIRSKDFLRKATKICKSINEQNISEEEKLNLINDKISELIENKSLSKNESENQVIKKEVASLSDSGPAIRNFLYYDRLRDEFLVRKVAENLSNKDKKRLKLKAQELIDLL